MDETTAHYRKPSWFTQQVFNRFVAWLTRRGVSVWGSRVLEVRGRTSGEPRRVPVNVLDHEGTLYLVSPRGEGQWVRNVRAAGGRLATIVGRRREEWLARELTGADKVPVLREYLRRWKLEAGTFFDGLSADASDADLAVIAPRHPVFVLVPFDQPAPPAATAAPAAPAEPTGAGDDATAAQPSPPPAPEDPGSSGARAQAGGPDTPTAEPTQAPGPDDPTSAGEPGT